MNHPFVKKLLGNELLMWGLGTLIVVALPVGIVVLEATPKRSASEQTTRSDAKDHEKNGKSQLPSAEPIKERVVTAELQPIQGTRAESAFGTSASTASIGSDQNGRHHTADVDILVPGDSSLRVMLTETASDSIGNGILYFGGDSTEGSTAAQNHAATVDVENDALGEKISGVIQTADAGSGNVASTQVIATVASNSSETNPENVNPGPTASMSADGKKSAPRKSMTKKKKEVDHPAGRPAESDEIARERTEVSVIRPKGIVVKSLEEVVVRYQARTKLFPYVLVRSGQKSASWWVQNGTLRRGTYIRSLAQFGNRATKTDSKFSLVVAFASDIKDVPKPGTQMRELPEDVLLSQEIKFTLRK
jgi:hypothetical protein